MVMPASKEKDAKFCRLGTVLLGCIILILGLYSHFESAWVKTDLGDGDLTSFKLYELCNLPGATRCPKIAMERYFVAVVIITFILSLVALYMTHYHSQDGQSWRRLDMRYHVLGAVLLFIGGILYIVSTEEINNLFSTIDGSGPMWKFKRPEKLAAGSLAIFQAVLFGIMCSLVRNGIINNNVAQKTENTT